MAQRTKRKLPTSAYALPGALAINHINTIPDDDGECGGLIEIELARTAEMEKLVAPRFIFLTTKNRKIGDGKPERGAFLLLQTMSVEGNDEIILLRGVWLCDKPDFLKYFKHADWIVSEPGNKKIWGALNDDDLIVCSTWPDTGGIAEAELTIAVKRAGEREDDLEPLFVRAISRDVAYGKELARSDRKLELIADATGKPVRASPAPPAHPAARPRLPCGRLC